LFPKYLILGLQNFKEHIWIYSTIISLLQWAIRKNRCFRFWYHGSWGSWWEAKWFLRNYIIDMVDSKISEFNQEEVKRLVLIGLMCCQTSPNLRPSNVTCGSNDCRSYWREHLALIGHTYNNTTNIPLAETLSSGS